MNAALPRPATLSLYQGVKSHDTGQYFCNARQFAIQTLDNKVERLNSGEETFAAILKAMKSAQKFIWIADWQMAFDVELGQRGNATHAGRLIEVIRQIISARAVQIRVLLFRSPLDAVPGTYDGMVAQRINAINGKGYPGKVIVMLQGPTTAQKDSFDYSHHQKFVVVDGSVGFIGGIDLTHGRFCGPEFDVVVDPQRFVLNDMYNPCATKLRPMAPHEKEMVEQGFAEPYGGTLIDEGCQPCMPWQDVHIKITGPATVDIHRNFVRRWNGIVYAKVAKKQPSFVFIKVEGPSFTQEAPANPGMIDIAWLDACGATPLLKAAQASKPGSAMVQIVRSVSSAHLQEESPRGQIPDDLQLYPEKMRETMAQCIRAWRGEHQPNILNAMVNCIRSADNYIYIETQFFISQFGRAGGADSTRVGNEDDGIRNMIADELVKRITSHIVAGTNFHVYLVIPVHPEGQITDGSVWKQQWLALATLHHGSRSVIGRIKEALKISKRDPAEWRRYLTVLNMRSYGVATQYAREPYTFRENFAREIGRYVVTEQVYIHSKLLIVDDAVAIVGSANINDRSLTGNGDTEIAAVVVDTEDVRYEDLGEPRFKVHTRKFARELRRSLWSKHFGFELDDKKYFESTKRAERANAPVVPIEQNPPRVVTESRRFRDILPWQSILDKPCHPDTVKAIQKIAGDNARAYETVFLHTPRNGMKHFDDILKHYSRPYPVTAAAAAKGQVQDAQRIRGQITGMAAQQSEAHVSSNDKAWVKTQADEAYRRAIESVPGNVSKGSHGVVPPALAPTFMTSSLMQHQQDALRVPMEDFGNRYITYEGDRVHDITRAIDHLKANVLGFFVLAPLSWGEGVAVDGGVVKHSTVDLAQNDSPTANNTQGMAS